MIKVRGQIKDNGVAGAIAALDRVEWEIRRQAEDIPEAGSVALKHHLADAVAASGNYAPYNETYAHWKREIFGSDGDFWTLSGDLFSALVSRQLGGGRWLGGFAAGIYDSGSKSYKNGKPREIVWYLGILEKGGTFRTTRGVQHHPARPLIGPAQTLFAATVWPGIQDKSRGKVAAAWRQR